MVGAKYTPGPWVVEDPFGPDQYSIVQDGLEAYEWQFIAHIPVGIPAEGLMPRQEAQANARLIAAAPDMLAALKGILSNPGGRCTAEQWQDGLRAVAKAEGR